MAVQIIIIGSCNISCIVGYCRPIIYKYFNSASHGVSQSEALSVHFRSRKKVRLKAKERRGNGSRENTMMVVLSPNMKSIMALGGRREEAELRAVDGGPKQDGVVT